MSSQEIIYYLHRILTTLFIMSLPLVIFFFAHLLGLLMFAVFCIFDSICRILEKIFY